MKILAIGSHPDDIEIFMFGLLSACADRGDEICLVIATDGSLGGQKPSSELTKIRKLESERGLISLGKPSFLNFKDGSLHDERDAPKEIKNVIENNNPDLVITHAPEDYHPDHRTLSNYVKNAVGFSCPVLFCETLLGVNFIPEYYVDITKFFELKKEAIFAHTSQNPGRFFEATKILNRFRSAQCNAPNNHYAETYRFEKSFPFSDIRQMLPSSPVYKPYYKNIDEALI
jgi:N-acetylglucosamine malate deacetylase 1